MRIFCIGLNYAKHVRKTGAIIIGRRTYQIMKDADEFSKIGNPFTIVITNSRFKDNEN